MNQRQNAQYRMIAACQSTASQYMADWSGYAPFKIPWTAVLAQKAILDGIIANQTAPYTAAGRKGELRASLKMQGLKAVTALEWLGGSTHDATLQKQAHLTGSDIDKMKEAALIGIMTKRLDLVSLHLPALAAVQYMPVDQQNLRDAIAAFTTALGSPTAEHDDQELITMHIDQHLRSMMQTMEEECDPAAATLTASHADFAGQWLLSREIGKPAGRRTRALEVQVTDSETGEPLARAVISVSGINTGIKLRRTGKTGAVYIQTLAGGTYQVSSALEGYVSDTRAATITDGQMNVLTLAMVKAG